jgi:hypothetical protein
MLELVASLEGLLFMALTHHGQKKITQIAAAAALPGARNIPQLRTLQKRTGL